MRKLVFCAEAHDLVGIIEDSIFNDKCREEELGSEDLTNYWVNDILRVDGKIPVSTLYRHLDEVETYCTLTASDQELFVDILLHMMKDFDLGDLGNPTVHHQISGGTLKFYILRG